MRSLVPLLLISALSAAAHAEGLYVEGGAFARHYDLGVTGAAVSGESAEGHVLSSALRLGYDIGDRWAVEAGYFNHGSPSSRYGSGAPAGELGSRGHSWVLAGRGTLLLGERFALVGRLGLARNRSSLSGTGEAASQAVTGATTALYAGAGLETTIAPSWRLGLAWEHLGMSRDRLGSVINGLSMTLRYKF